MFKKEKQYRKWLGINQLHKGAALTLNIIEGIITIKIGDKVKLTFSDAEFDDITANEILEKLGAET